MTAKSPAVAGGRRNVIIFRDKLLQPSETFVLSQGEALRRFVPWYTGSRRVPGLSPPSERTIVINSGTLTGRISEVCFKAFGRAPFLERRLRELQPALVHAHFGPGGALALPLAEQLACPLIVTFHGYDASSDDKYWRNAGYVDRSYFRRRPVLQREGRLFLAISKFIGGLLVAQGFPSERVVVHYTGVDRSFFYPDAAVLREPVVLFVGRLVDVKGCEFALRAFGELAHAVPGARLVIIGDGPRRASLEAQSEEFRSRCTFLGSQPRTMVREWMNRARVLCAPSGRNEVGNAEGFGMVFAEAQAMGLPVVSFASGGIPEAVAEGETGFLAPEGNWRELVQPMRRLFDEEDLWRRFSQAGQRRVAAEFDLANQTARLESIYESVSAEQRR